MRQSCDRSVSWTLYGRERQTSWSGKWKKNRKNPGYLFDLFEMMWNDWCRFRFFWTRMKLPRSTSWRKYELCSASFELCGEFSGWRSSWYCCVVFSWFLLIWRDICSSKTLKKNVVFWYKLWKAEEVLSWRLVAVVLDTQPCGLVVWQTHESSGFKQTYTSICSLG